MWAAFERRRGSGKSAEEERTSRPVMPVAMSSMRSSPGAIRLGEECLVGPEGPALAGEPTVAVSKGAVGTTVRRGAGGGGGRGGKREGGDGAGTGRAGEEKMEEPEEGRKEERMWWRLWTVEVRGEF